MVEPEEIRRIAALFFCWLLFLLVGGAVTAVFSEHGALESFSGMTSAVCNIGPCYISGEDLRVLSPVIKVVYVIGMLAGRLEILPVLLLFNPKAWR